ncbi:helix-turn-helix domain-containing protein [Kribbella sp. NPDC051718]|uniref:helix-turn-helix domain-containing protein n=1 Tax=Kribbella sp. NPDC051718 TaxID=3155168 RepID=UPI00344410ED
MAISKSGKTNSGTTPKAKTAGARKHDASPDQPNRTRRTPTGTAKSVAGKRATHRPVRRPAPLAGRPSSEPEQSVVSVDRPSLGQLGEVESIIHRGNEITITQGKTSVKVSGTTLTALRQFITALNAGPLNLLIENPDTEITSQEAADLLNVSRPYVVKLAREGRLAHRLVGNRHRFLLSDVRALERAQYHERERLLAEMMPEGGYADGDF